VLLPLLLSMQPHILFNTEQLLLPDKPLLLPDALLKFTTDNSILRR
jgi:hypothetical protein